MNLFIKLALLGCLFCFAQAASAHDPTHANASWYNTQEMNIETQKRLGVSYKSCCDNGDHYQTRFRILNDGSKYGTDTYEYWDKEKAVWKLVPPDIIQRKPTPDRVPVLFRSKYNGTELCFIVPESDI